MSKELEEAWTTICHYNEEVVHDMGSEYIENPLKEELDTVNKALLELKAIKESNPSEAMGCLQWMGAHRIEFSEFLAPIKDISEFNTIKKALLKAQEQEKALKIISEKNVLIYSLKIADNLTEYNRWVEDEDALTQEEFDLLKRWLDGKQ